MNPHVDRHRSGYWKDEFLCGQMQNWAVTGITWMENISQEEAKSGSVLSAKQQEG